MASCFPNIYVVKSAHRFDCTVPDLESRGVRSLGRERSCVKVLDTMCHKEVPDLCRDPLDMEW